MDFEYQLEKRIWTEEDFEVMGWHDCHIYEWQLGDDLVFDIDYILKWNAPEVKGLDYTFWIAPATLVFKKPSIISFHLEFGLYTQLEIGDIERTLDSNNVIKWAVRTQQGDIEFKAEGYTQYIRQDPFFEYGQIIDYDERNGYSIERTTNQENLNRSKESVVKRREKDKKDYECAKKRELLLREIEKLELERELGLANTKDYLVKMRGLKEKRTAYEKQLVGSRFEV